MKTHPLADLLPMIDGHHWLDFVASIKTRGLLEPIVTHDGMILDGRNRYRACAELGIEPTFKPYDGTDPLGFVLAVNLNRRHLTAAQRAAMAAELSNLEHGTNQYATKVDGSNEPSTRTTAEAAAKMMNVSVASVKRAKKRLHDDPDAHAAVKAGHKAPKAPAATPTVEDQAAASLQIQQMALDRGISWAHRGDEISRAIRSATHQKVLRAVDIADPATAQTVAGVLDRFAGKTLDEQYQAHRADVATLAEGAQQKLARLVDRELQHRLALFDQEVRDKAREQLPAEVKALRAATERANAEFKKYAAMRKGIPAQMTDVDYKFLLNVLHPDRAPEDRRDKFARAFDIVRRLDAYIKAFEA